FRLHLLLFLFSSRRRHTRSKRDWSSDVCSSDLHGVGQLGSPGFDCFHSVKSRGSRFTSETASPCCTSSGRCPESVPYPSNSPTEIGRASCRERVWICCGDGSSR